MPLGQEGIGTGWAALGSALGGPTPGTYERQLLLNYQGKRAKYDADRAMSEEAIARDMRTARAGLTQENLIAAGYDSRLAPILSSVIGSNKSPSIAQFGVLGAPGAGAGYLGAQEAMQQGNFPAFNQNMALATGKQYQPVQEMGGMFLPDAATMDQLALGVLTPGTEATIAQKRAAAEASVAAAGASRARAGLYEEQRKVGPFNPNTGKGRTAEGDAILRNIRAGVAANKFTAEVGAAELRRLGYLDLADELFKPDAATGAGWNDDVPVSTPPAPVVAAPVAIPGTAMSALLANPSRAAEFDAKYGKGAAAKVLGR